MLSRALFNFIRLGPSGYSILFYYSYSRAFTSTHYHILYVRNVRYILRDLDAKCT